MDSLERAATGDTALPPDSGESVSADPTKTVEPTQPAQQQVEPASDADYLHTPHSEPQLEAQRKRLVEVERQMISSNTRKTMAREKEFRREQDAMTAERNQLAAALQNATAQHQGAQPQQNGNGGTLSHLPAHLQSQMTPELQEVFGAMDRSRDSEFKSLREQNDALMGHVEKLQGDFAQSRDQAIVQTYKPQAEALSAKYGDALTPDVSQAVIQEGIQKGLSLEAALLSVAPHVVQNHMMAVARVTAQKEINDQYGDLGALAGMDNETLGQAPTEKFVQGEPWEATFARRHGQKALRNMLRETPD